jgi:dCTP diphosphatase
MHSLSQLTEIIKQFRDERDWAQFHTPKDMVLSLMLEAGELAEIFQWKNESECKALMALADEISDTLYWLLLLSGDFGIDLEAAFLRKMQKNRDKYPVEKCKGQAGKYHDYS